MQELLVAQVGFYNKGCTRRLKPFFYIKALHFIILLTQSNFFVTIISYTKVYHH